MNESIERPSRKLVLEACKLLAFLGHSDIDELLLEIGNDYIDAGRNRGSRHARAIAIGQHAMQNPDDRIADDRDLAWFLVERAAQNDQRYPDQDIVDLPLETRESFRAEMERSGFELKNGTLIEKVAKVNSLGIRTTEGGGNRNYLGGGHVARPKNSLSSGVAQNRPPARDPEKTAHNAKAPSAKTKSKRIFVVHGRNTHARNEVELFLTKLKLEPIVLQQQPNKGRSILVKFQEVAEDASFAVVIMTAEDEGGLIGEAKQRRARQNVVFELGFFIGKLGSENVCALLGNGVEKPSDFEGIGYVAFGDTTYWKTELAKELHHAGIPFDASNVL